MALLKGFSCDFICHVIGGACGTGGFNSQQYASCRHVTGADVWKGMGIIGLSWERGGNVMEAALGKRWDGALEPEVVAQWDPGFHYFVRVGLDDMRHGRGRGKGARQWPGGHPQNWFMGQSWW